MGFFSKGRERRQHIRHSGEIAVQIKNRTYDVSGKLGADESEAESAREAAGKNISLGGLCFFCDIACRAGTVLEMTIRISNIRDDAGRAPMSMMSYSVPVKATGRAMWCKSVSGRRGYEVGVMFDNISEDDRQILKKYLND